jgi:hypothetical protein
MDCEDDSGHSHVHPSFDCPFTDGFIAMFFRPSN